jgi:D-serine deaminase-like pyridoxal phosphate-dependent protein
VDALHQLARAVELNQEWMGRLGLRMDEITTPPLKLRNERFDVKQEKRIARGTKIKDIPTPSLLIDLEAMESNLRQMAAFFNGSGPKLRPHFKAHQVLSLAKRQMKHGAIGVTCARLEQAEKLVRQGIHNILIANEIAGESKIRDFIDLGRRAPVLVAVDNAEVATDMARLAGERRAQVNVLVDVDVRLARCGVMPGQPALALTHVILEKGLNFRGLMGYEGHVALPPGPEKDGVVCDALRRLTETKSLIEQAGIPVGIVSCGGTSDFSIAAKCPHVTEIQAGSYLLMDSSYAPFAPEFRPSLSILSTVISKTHGERIVVDAGLRAMSGEHGLPSVKGAPGLRTKALHIEHSILEITDSTLPIEVGTKVEICVRFLDQTLVLHDHLFAVRNGEVEEMLRIER